jgi:hypothetical protein
MIAGIFIILIVLAVIFGLVLFANMDEKKRCSLFGHNLYMAGRRTQPNGTVVEMWKCTRESCDYGVEKKVW